VPVGEGRIAWVPVTRSRLSVIAVVSLLATALLSLAVSRGSSGFQLDRNAIHLLGRPPDVDLWKHVADLLAAPVIAVVVVVSLVFGALRRILLRVGVFGGFAAAAFLISEQMVKPLVGERFFGELSFPSGNVTAVCATALAMWIALYPVLGKWARSITFLFGVAWTFLMSVAVVGAIWHTPLDCVGSVLLSIGVVTAGAAIFQPKPAPPSAPATAERSRVRGQV
jgi:PAP2 superfamily